LVHIESKAHEGTKVLLLLPRSTEPPGTAVISDSPADAAAPGPRCRVLLVEDDVHVASLTSAMLVELGHEVVPVTTGHAALEELAQTSDIGLVLSDIMMPGGMDGVALVREMRLRQIHLPVLLVSGFAATAKREAEKEGIPLLAKPYTFSDLAAKLHDTMRAAPPGSQPPSQVARA
jgi:CheY-like chemotaxis protein